MATEPNVLPGVETETAPETVEPEVTAPEVGADADEADGEVKAEKSETKDPNDAIERMQRRINKKHAVAAKALAENEYLKRQLDELRSKESGQTEKHDEPDIEALVEYKAKIREFTRTSNQLCRRGIESTYGLHDHSERPTRRGWGFREARRNTKFIHGSRARGR